MASPLCRREFVAGKGMSEPAEMKAFPERRRDRVNAAKWIASGIRGTAFQAVFIQANANKG
jgi:hypothetical protein